MEQAIRCCGKEKHVTIPILSILFSDEGGETNMATQEETPENISKVTPPESDPTKIDRDAAGGAKNSFGAQSGRPSTDHSVVEVMNEEVPPLAGN
jgi:hypothetical protein